MRRVTKPRPGRLARLYTADKRQWSRAREREEMPPPKLTDAQRDFLRMAKARIRQLFFELQDEIIELMHEEVGR
jgi:hypothetical protein